MKILFIHQNFPGQFKYLAAHYGANPEHEAWFITKRKEMRIPGVRKILYEPAYEAGPETHPFVRNFEDGICHGQAVAEKCMQMRKQGLIPDIIVAHPGWGESIYIKDVFPNKPLLNYFEFYFHAQGADVGFDPEFPLNLNDLMRVRTRNSLLQVALEGCDWGITPTRWQWQQHPDSYRHRISVIHEGVDTQIITPAKESFSLTLPNGLKLSRRDEVITYVSRNLEPYRGFPTFIRAVEKIQQRRPKAHIVVVGGDEVSYGRRLPEGQTYRELMLDKVDLDMDRVHFLGRVPYRNFLSILRISSAHIYLTYPFVLSWSMLEAMACGCLVIGSDTPPVKEVIDDGVNGLLVDFFSPEQIAERVDEVLDHPDQMAKLRHAARRTIISRYDLRRVTLPRQIGLVDLISAGVLA